MRETKWYWHIHHKVLVEPLIEPLKNRIEYIKTNKPENERKLRLKLLKPVKGKLPVGIVKAWDACDKAWDACDKAREAYVKAWEAYVKAREANKAKIETLHKKECPNCPWDGKTIFPKKGDEKK